MDESCLNHEQNMYAGGSGKRCESLMCWYDEAFTQREIYDETGWCRNCCHEQCQYCGN